MTAELEAVFGRNITLVYNSIDISSLDTKFLKTIFNDGEPAIIQIPGNVVVFTAQNKPHSVQIDNKRIVIDFSDEINEFGNYPVADYADFFNKYIISKESKLEAYGFNYNLGFKFTNTITNVLNDLFASGIEKINDKLCGKIIDFYPVFRINKDNLVYQYTFNRHSDNQLKVHVNVHFQENSLPELQILKEKFKYQCNTITESLLRLIN